MQTLGELLPQQQETERVSFQAKVPKELFERAKVAKVKLNRSWDDLQVAMLKWLIQESK
jgi:hypothetical protein